MGKYSIGVFIGRRPR